ncbi:hypothetical protein [Dietzia timorensis]|uniref:Uncharacterized protein n=1 Tax=Dietzia timorensis TaxID=499555 RepID=A0A173LHW7_9ACTN|nr:hypothetical protein [Dietzia timorensis]ANI91865.1 Hypothetical protein BJL86_1073 [Dietzia timorensis]
MHEIEVDLARPEAGSFATAWPKIVTAHLPGGGTSQATFHSDGRVELSENAARAGVYR